MNSNMRNELNQISYQQSKPFCYHCYEVVESGECSQCGSDDLMRYVEGVGCEYGISWVTKHLIESNLEVASFSESFEEMIEGLYGETTKVGFMELSTVQVMKDQDPVAWRIAMNEHIDFLEEDGQIVSLEGGDYYWVDDVNKYIEENLVIDEGSTQS